LSYLLINYFYRYIIFLTLEGISMTGSRDAVPPGDSKGHRGEEEENDYEET
jgi:hypothetical protein